MTSPLRFSIRRTAMTSAAFAPFARTVQASASLRVRITSRPSTPGRPMASGSIFQATGYWQIWKVAATGGTPKQVTQFGGYRPIESNGVLYYFSRGGVWSSGVNGGPERKVLSLGQNVAWFPVRDGLLFVSPAQPDSGTTALSHWNATTGTIQPVARLPHPAIRRFSFFEKTSTILYERTDYESHDIIVLENYDSMN